MQKLIIDTVFTDNTTEKERDFLVKLGARIGLASTSQGFLPFLVRTADDQADFTPEGIKLSLKMEASEDTGNIHIRYNPSYTEYIFDSLDKATKKKFNYRVQLESVGSNIDMTLNYVPNDMGVKQQNKFMDLLLSLYSENLNLILPVTEEYIAEGTTEDEPESIETTELEAPVKPKRKSKK